MKRYVAKKKLKRTCNLCRCCFSKGDVYYKHRDVFVDDHIGVVAAESTLCPKCYYKLKDHEKRLNEFKKVCQHPREFAELILEPMPGEPHLKEPAYHLCTLCWEPAGW